MTTMIPPSIILSTYITTRQCAIQLFGSSGKYLTKGSGVAPCPTGDGVAEEEDVPVAVFHGGTKDVV